MDSIFEASYLGSRVRLYDTWLEQEGHGVRRVIPLSRIESIYPAAPLVAGVHVEGGAFSGIVPVPLGKKQELVGAVEQAMSRIGPELTLHVIHVGGYGTDLVVGEEYFAAFGESAVAVSHPWAEESLTVPYAEIVEFDIGGRGAMESDAGLVGGGFGVGGAAVGMALAGVVNAATRTKSVETGIWWKTADSELFLFTYSAEPDSLRVELAQQIARMNGKLEGGHGPAAVGKQDLVAQLRGLAELREAGVLTDAEFQAAKQRVLESI